MAGSVADARRGDIVAAARDLLEQGGPEAVTMRAIAERLGIRAPSLYKHVPDKHALEVALVVAGFEELEAAFREATPGSTDPLADLARAYRAWAAGHPHLYRLMTERPLPRTELPPGLEAAAARPLVEAVGGDETLARTVWAFAHGLASLELAGRFPPDADVDAAWAAGIGAFRLLAAKRASEAWIVRAG